MYSVSPFFVCFSPGNWHLCSDVVYGVGTHEQRGLGRCSLRVLDQALEALVVWSKRADWIGARCFSGEQEGLAATATEIDLAHCAALTRFG